MSALYKRISNYSSMATQDNLLYEHRYIASLMLGRDLKPEEVVHHKDENKRNNFPDNLMVFKTKADHTAYHRGCEAVLSDDGTYYCPNKKVHRCKCCNKIIYNTSTMCIDCYSAKRAENIPPKEDLEKLIYTTPFEEIGRRYGVSGKAVTKWCKKYGLPYRKKDMVKE